MSNEQMRESVLGLVHASRRRRTVEALRRETFDGVIERARAAARAHAASQLPESVTVRLCELLLYDENRDARFDAVRDADRHLDDFFAENGGVKWAEPRRLSELTRDALRMLAPYLRVSVRLSAERDPIVFGDPATFAHALLLLLRDLDGDVMARVAADDDGEGWLSLSEASADAELAHALMRSFGGSVEGQELGVRMGFARWSKLEGEPRPQPVDVALREVLRGRAGLPAIDALVVGECPLLEEGLREVRVDDAREACERLAELDAALVIANARVVSEICTRPELGSSRLVVHGEADFEVARRIAGCAPSVSFVNDRASLLAAVANAVAQAERERASRRLESLAAVTAMRDDYAATCRSLADDLEQRGHHLLQAAQRAGLGAEVGEALRELDAAVETIRG